MDCLTREFRNIQIETEEQEDPKHTDPKMSQIQQHQNSKHHTQTHEQVFHPQAQHVQEREFLKPSGTAAEMSKRRKSAPSAFMNSSAAASAYSTEQIVNQMEKEQDRMVITLLREIQQLKLENNIYKHKLASCMDTGAFSKFLSANSLSGGHSPYPTAASTPVPYPNTPTPSLSGSTPSYSLSSASSSTTTAGGPFALQNDFYFINGNSRNSSVSRSRFGSVAGGSTAVASSTNESTPFTSPLPSRRPSLNNHHFTQTALGHKKHVSVSGVTPSPTPVPGSGSSTPTAVLGQGASSSAMQRNKRRSSSTSYTSQGQAGTPAEVFQQQLPKLSVSGVSLKKEPSRKPVPAAITDNTSLKSKQTGPLADSTSSKTQKKEAIEEDKEYEQDEDEDGDDDDDEVLFTDHTSAYEADECE